jgi:hypothetical protein
MRAIPDTDTGAIPLITLPGLEGNRGGGGPPPAEDISTGEGEVPPPPVCFRFGSGGGMLTNIPIAWLGLGVGALEGGFPPIATVLAADEGGGGAGRLPVVDC